MFPGQNSLRIVSKFFALFTLALPLLFTGCAWTGRTSTLDPKGPIAQIQFDLFMITVYVCVFLFVVVGGAFLYVVWKYRERPGQPETPIPQNSHGNPLIEIGLIASSVFMLVIIAVPTVQAIWITHDMPDRPDSHLGAYYGGEFLSPGEEEEVLTIRAEGYQWWWAFEYPQLGLTTGNEFVIPAGKVVRLELRSKDVIHSFWLPKIAGKVDLIPGRNNWMWIQAGNSYNEWLLDQGLPPMQEGHRAEYENYLEAEVYDMYYGQCAEFCGDSHAYMLFRTKVVSPEEFEAWVAEQKQPAPAPDGGGDWGAWFARALGDPSSLAGDPIQEGAYLYHTKGTCIQCHKVEGSPSSNGVLGPDLTKVGSRTSLAAGWMDHMSADGGINAGKQYENLVDWIYASQDIKPGNLMYYGDNALQHIINPEDPDANPLTREEVAKIATWLQTLQ